MKNTLKQGTSEEKQGSATMNKKLKPCPFCGCPAELYIIPKEENPQWDKNGIWWRVRCASEWCIIGRSIKIYCVDENDAIAEWNSRKRKNKAAYEYWEGKNG